MTLKKYEFTCPFCRQSKVTFLPEDEYMNVVHRRCEITEVLPEDKFSKTYINFFLFQVCSECQADNLGDFAGGKNFYDITEGKDSSFIEANVIEMWDNAKRQ